MVPCEDTATHAVLALLSERARGSKQEARITPDEIADVIGATVESVRYALEDLKADAIIEKMAEGSYAVRKSHVCVSTDLSHPRSGARGRKHTAVSRGVLSTTASGSKVSTRPSGQVNLESSSLTSSSVSTGWPDLPAQVTAPASKWNGRTLAFYFNSEVRAAARRDSVSLGPAAVNIGALTGNFAAWRRENVTSDVIKEMIDLFTADLARRTRKGIPVWKIFLTYRTALYRQVEQMAHDSAHEHDVEFTTTSDDDEFIDTSNWIGAK